MLLEQVGIKVETRGGLSLVSGRDCAKLLKACSNQGAVIIGIEGFRLRGDQIEPDMDLIADFSEFADAPLKEGSTKSVLQAQQFFATVESIDDLWFEFTFLSR